MFLGHIQGVNSSNIVGNPETAGFGHSLILKPKKREQNSGLISQSTHTFSHQEAQHLLKHSQVLFPKSNTAIISHGEKSYIEITEQDQKFYYIESKYLTHDIIGYAGPINIGIVLTPAGNIKSIHHISSKETQSYLRIIEEKGYYQQYSKIPLNNESTIDGVSGATISSKAIAETATASIHILFPEPFDNLIDDHKIHKFAVISEISNVWVLHSVILTLLFSYTLLRRVKKSKKHITVLRIITLLYLGYYLNNSFTYTSILHPFMGVTLSSLTSIYIALVLIGSIWGKNVYCKFICPFGNAQCLLNQASPNKWSSKFLLSNTILKYIRIALSTILITGIFLGLDQWKNYELFPDLFGVQLFSFWFSIALLLVLISIKYPMLWCRSLCPTGFVLDSFSGLIYKGVHISTKPKPVIPKVKVAL